MNSEKYYIMHLSNRKLWLCEGHFSSECVNSLRNVTFVMWSIGLLQKKCHEDNKGEWIITQTEYKKESWNCTECVKEGGGGIVIFWLAPGSKT